MDPVAGSGRAVDGPNPDRSVAAPTDSGAEVLTGAALVTGASQGIGLATAIGLAQRGFEVILVCRDRGRGEDGWNQVAAQASIPPTLLLADLSRQQEVRRVAQEVRSRFSPLTLLIHNAAIVTRERSLTEDGIERQFATNHLAVYLLTHELLPLLLRSAPARIVVTASQVERHAQIDLSDLSGSTAYDPNQAYAQSKLANVLFTYELAERLKGHDLTVNCLHPGVVRTQLLQDLAPDELQPGFTTRWVNRLRALAGRTLRTLGIRPPIQDWALTPEAGARTTLFVATAPELAGVSGQFFRESQVTTTSPQSQDPTLRRQLWLESARLVGVDADWP